MHFDSSYVFFVVFVLMLVVSSSKSTVITSIYRQVLKPPSQIQAHSQFTTLAYRPPTSLPLTTSISQEKSNNDMANPSAFNVQKTNEDRIDRLWTPTTSLAIDALRTTKTAPVRGSPKIIPLIRASTGLDRTRPDLGLLDLWVDDGSDGDLDKTIRSLRFSAASSNIYSLFAPERKQVPAAHVSGGTVCLSKEANQVDSQEKITTESQPKGQQLGKHSNQTCGIEQAEKVSEDREWLDTEPVTPPTPTRSRTNVQGVFSLLANNKEAAKNRSRDDHGGAQRNSQEQVQEENVSNKRPDKQGSEDEPEVSPRKPGSRLLKLFRKLCSGSKDRENHDSERHSSSRSLRRRRLHKFVKKATRLFTCAFS